MDKLTKKEEEFLVIRTGNTVSDILDTSKTMRDVGLESYRAGYTHANEDRRKIMKEESLNE